MLRHGKNPYAKYDEEMLFNAVDEVKLASVGEFSSYSNFGFSLLGTLLARATGTSYKKVVETRIFAPLALTGATMTGWSSESVAPPFTREGGKANHWDFSALAGAGAARGAVTAP